LKRQEGELELNHVSDYSGIPENAQLEAIQGHPRKNGSPKAAAVVFTLSRFHAFMLSCFHDIRVASVLTL